MHVQDFVTAVHARAGKASGEGKLSSRAEVRVSPTKCLEIAHYVHTFALCNFMRHAHLVTDCEAACARLC